MARLRRSWSLWRTHNRETIDEILGKSFRDQMIDVYRLHPDMFALHTIRSSEREKIYMKDRKVFAELGFTLNDLSAQFISNTCVNDVPTKDFWKHANQVINAKAQISYIAETKPAKFVMYGFDIAKINTADAVLSLYKYMIKYKKYQDRVTELKEIIIKLDKSELRGIIKKMPVILSWFERDDYGRTKLNGKDWLLLLCTSPQLESSFITFMDDELIEYFQHDAFAFALTEKVHTVKMNNAIANYERVKNGNR